MQIRKKINQQAEKAPTFERDRVAEQTPEAPIFQ
jgi:hypothetical protein